MATLSTGSSHGGKRALDHELPLVPFIDLLLCCVMFLLATQVWNQLAAMNASVTAPASESPIVAPSETPAMYVLVTADRYVVGTGVGDRTELPFASGAPDPASLREHLAPRRASSAGEVIVSGDDGIAYASIIEAMDAIASSGFDRVVMGSSAPL